jgi:hypothetical protein
MEHTSFASVSPGHTSFARPPPPRSSRTNSTAFETSGRQDCPPLLLARTRNRRCDEGTPHPPSDAR